MCPHLSLQEKGGVELSSHLVCHVSTLCMGDASFTRGRRVVACTYDGEVSVMKPALAKPHWRSPKTWRSPPTGGLQFDVAFGPGTAKQTNGDGGRRSATMVLPVLAAPKGGGVPVEAELVAVCDPVGDAVHICSLSEGGKTIGRLKLKAGSRPCARRDFEHEAGGDCGGDCAHGASYSCLL